MAPSFSMAIDKMKSGDMGRSKGHNCRQHPTASQLRPEAWFTREGRHVVQSWRDDVAERATKLAKRKDAVVGLSLIFQIGNQTDWRNEPEPEFPEGQPKGAIADPINALCRAVRAWASQEFGEENVVGIDLHTDESTPHVHLVVTPVHEGRLQAKHWLDGPAACAKLRKRAWSAVNALVPCQYTPGAAGGLPHDPLKAAGQVPVPAPSLLDRMSGHARSKELERQNAELREENAALKQALFSRKKGHYVAEAVAEAKQAKANEEAAKGAAEGHRRELGEAKRELTALQQTVAQQASEIKAVRAYNAKLSDENNELIDEVRGLKRELGRGAGRGMGR